MGEKINLNKGGFDKRIYNKTIDTSFSQLGLPPIIQVDPPQSVDIFFKLYNTLFYQIPELGEINSHEYIVKTSGEYIAFDKKDELVRALEKEIADTRKKLFQSQQDLTKLFPEEEIEPLPEIDDVELPPRVAPSLNIINTPPPVPPPPPPSPTPPPPASSADQEMYDAGYNYQVITYNALVNNINSFAGLGNVIRNQNDNLKEPNQVGITALATSYKGIDNFIGVNFTYNTALSTLSSLDPGPSTPEGKVLNALNKLRKSELEKDLRQAKDKIGSEEAKYSEWREAIKKKSSDKKKDALYKILAMTVDGLRETFRETNKFGNGFISIEEFTELYLGNNTGAGGRKNTSGYSNFG